MLSVASCASLFTRGGARRGLPPGTQRRGLARPHARPCEAWQVVFNESAAMGSRGGVPGVDYSNLLNIVGN